MIKELGDERDYSITADDFVKAILRKGGYEVVANSAHLFLATNGVRERSYRRYGYNRGLTF